ncbi:MAG TPA: protocatechuate 3,4-dioxygenase subunit beta, partial [Rhizobiaceae bacterium]|nr:protocatechuate 3,4-dioxygenase subunit beta [Rhizobiaceae bacterium]
MSNFPPETGAFFPRDRTRQPLPLDPSYKSSVLRAPQRALISFGNTLGEITGPAFGQSMLGELDNDLLTNFARPGQSAIGERIVVHGRVLDERGKPVPDVLVEVWQANAGGRYRHKREGYVAALDPDFGGCGRCLSDGEGRYMF